LLGSDREDVMGLWRANTASAVEKGLADEFGVW